MPDDKDKLPEPTPEEKKEADKEVEEWLRKQGYPKPGQ